MSASETIAHILMMALMACSLTTVSSKPFFIYQIIQLLAFQVMEEQSTVNWESFDFDIHDIIRYISKLFRQSE